MKHFTREYVENYSPYDKSREQLLEDIKIASTLLREYDVSSDMRKLLQILGQKGLKVLSERYGDYAIWSTKYVNDLPDSCFMWVEKGGRKDQQGKTVPRSFRHLPFKTAEGKIDVPHVRNALARLDAVKDKNGKPMPESLKKDIKSRLQKILETMKKRKSIETEEFMEDEFGVARLFGHPAGQLYQVAKLKKYMSPHKVFCEPFAGSATLFFAKDPTEEKAYLNDIGFYSTLLKAIKNLSDSDISKLTKMNWTNSKAYFDKMRALKAGSALDYIHKQVYLIRWAYGGAVDLNWNSHHDGKTSTHNKPERWQKVRDRLKKATITKMDYADIIKKVDSPDTFFYIDPPYYKKDDKRIRRFNIGEIKLEDFISVLKGIKGKFIATIGNEKDWINALKKAGFHVYMTKSMAGTPPQKASVEKKHLIVPFVSNYPLKGIESECIGEGEQYELDEAEYQKPNVKCMGCGMEMYYNGDYRLINCALCGGGMLPISRTLVHENFSDSVAIHSIDSADMSDSNPLWLELTGILFHRGTHKGITYEDDSLKSARLVPRNGEKLCYVNFYHKKDESHRVGILAEIWWDDKVAWYCPTNDIHGKGALMYRSFITDKDAIYEVKSGKIGNVSAELGFDTYYKPEDMSKPSEQRKEYAVHVQVYGKAITPAPALKAADIEEACTIGKDGKRSCEKLGKGEVR